MQTELERFKVRMEHVEQTVPMFFHPDADIEEYRLAEGVEPQTPGQHRGPLRHLAD